MMNKVETLNVILIFCYILLHHDLKFKSIYSFCMKLRIEVGILNNVWILSLVEKNVFAAHHLLRFLYIRNNKLEKEFF